MKQYAHGDLEKETFSRLLAEWRLAETKTELARSKFEMKLQLICAREGIDGSATLDLDEGIIRIEHETIGDSNADQ